MILLTTVITAVALAVPVSQWIFATVINDPVQGTFDREFASIVAAHDWS